MNSHRRRRAGGALAAAVLAVLALGCGDRPETPAERPGVPAAPIDSVPAGPDEPAAEDRPASRTDTILIEGMPEPMEMRLVRPDPGFPLAFSVYVPADMEPVIGRLPSDRASARFVAAFGGVRQERAFLYVEVYGAGTTLAEAREDARAYAEERRGSVRRVGFGEHRGRVFRVVVEYPPEYGDGMAPRTARIMETWRWEDGSRLILTD